MLRPGPHADFEHSALGFGYDQLPLARDSLVATGKPYHRWQDSVFVVTHRALPDGMPNKYARIAVRVV